MKDEIKEILEDLIKIAKCEYYPDDLLDCENCQKLLDYITNLQESEAYYYGQYKDYKSRNNKAINFINEMLECAYIDGKYIMYDYSTTEILEIKKTLKGEDKDERKN